MKREMQKDVSPSRKGCGKGSGRKRRISEKAKSGHLAVKKGKENLTIKNTDHEKRGGFPHWTISGYRNVTQLKLLRKSTQKTEEQEKEKESNLERGERPRLTPD